MIDMEAVRAVVSQYEKFGWKLERILLKEPSNEVFSAFSDILIRTSTLDAIWFSRQSGSGRAWEIRRLTGTPFALVRVIDVDASGQEHEEILKTLELEMKERDVKTIGEISNGK